MFLPAGLILSSLRGTILIGCGLLFVLGGGLKQLEIAYARNGAVMFIDSFTLSPLNRRYLAGEIRMPVWRMAVLWGVVAFFDGFSGWAVGQLIS